MNKRIIALLITGAVLLSALAGCSDKKSEGENTSDASVSTPADNTEATEAETDAATEAETDDASTTTAA